MQKQIFGWPQAIGVIIIAGLMLAGVYTAIQISPSMPDAFSRFAAGFVSLTGNLIPGERLVLSVNPERVESGNATIFSWTHRNKSAGGMYVLTYPCTQDSYLGVEVSGGNKKILCETPSEVISADANLKLIPVSEREGLIEIPITFSYVLPNENTTEITASTTISVIGISTATENSNEEVLSSEESELPTAIPNEVVSKPETVTVGERTEKIYPLEAPASDPTPLTPPMLGKTDLTVRILAIGTISRTTNQFSATTSLHASDRIAIKFEVKNTGTANSGTWYFSSVLPTYPIHIFQSEAQPNLTPRSRIEFTLGFDQVEPNINGIFVINVDPTNSISEVNEDNNMATTSIKATTK